jgi:hypothetical protein
MAATTTAVKRRSDDGSQQVGGSSREGKVGNFGEQHFGERPRHPNRSHVMSTDSLDRSEDGVVKEWLKPLRDLLAKEDAELKEVDELIREAERKTKSMYQAEP